MRSWHRSRAGSGLLSKVDAGDVSAFKTQPERTPALSAAKRLVSTPIRTPRRSTSPTSPRSGGKNAAAGSARSRTPTVTSRGTLSAASGGVAHIQLSLGCAHTSRVSRRRLDVHIHTEEIRRIVAVLECDQPLVLGSAVGSTARSARIEVVDIRQSGVIGLHRLPIFACPQDVPL